MIDLQNIYDKKNYFSIGDSKILLCILSNDSIIQSYIAKVTDLTYSHVVNRLQNLKYKKLITTKKVGRTTVINLTSDGIIIAKNINQMVNYNIIIST